MIKVYKGEKWKEIREHMAQNKRYAVSNFGRVISFEKKMLDGKVLHSGYLDDHNAYPYRIAKKTRVGNKTKYKTLFIYHVVAKYFVKKKSPKQTHIIHLDHNSNNNLAENLRWVTKEEMLSHHQKSPVRIKARKKLTLHNIKSDGRILTVKKATELKKKILNPNRRKSLKEIAKEYGISEMHLYRIKSGENWGHIKV